MAGDADPFGPATGVVSSKPSLLQQAKTTLGSAVGAVGDVLEAPAQGVQHVIHGAMQGDLGEVARGAGILVPSVAGLVFGGPLGMIAGGEIGQEAGDLIGGKSRVDAARDIFGKQHLSGVGGFLEHAGLNAALDPLTFVAPGGEAAAAEGAAEGTSGIVARLPFSSRLGLPSAQLVSGTAREAAQEAAGGALRAASAALPGDAYGAVSGAATRLTDAAKNFSDPSAYRLSRLTAPAARGGAEMSAEAAADLEPRYAAALNQTQSAQNAIGLDLKRGLSPEEAGAYGPSTLPPTEAESVASLSGKLQRATAPLQTRVDRLESYSADLLSRANSAAGPVSAEKLATRAADATTAANEARAKLSDLTDVIAARHEAGMAKLTADNAGEPLTKWDHFNAALERNGVPQRIPGPNGTDIPNPAYGAAQKLFTEQPELATGPASRLFRQLNAVMPTKQLRYVVGDVQRNAAADVSASFENIQEARTLRTAVDDAAKLAPTQRVEDVARDVFKSSPDDLAKWQALQQNGGFSGTLFHTETAGQGRFATLSQKLTQPAGGLSMDIRNGQTLARMEAGADPATAALQTQHAMIGYTDLTPGIAAARKYYAPFATHLVKSGALSLEQIAANPALAEVAQQITAGQEQAKQAGGIGGKLANLSFLQTPVQAALYKEPLGAVPQALSGNLRAGLATVGSSAGGPTLGGLLALSSRIGATKGSEAKALTQLITGTTPGASIVAPTATALASGDVTGAASATGNTLVGLAQPAAALKAPGAPKTAAQKAAEADPFKSSLPSKAKAAKAAKVLAHLPVLPKIR